MYRYSIFEIKYFQNEISNIYMKATAIELYVLDGSKDLAKDVVPELIKTERNIMIKKEETTLTQLRDIAERDGDAAVINFIKSVPDSLSESLSKFFRK